jgi:hypothetical protein
LTTLIFSTSEHWRQLTRGQEQFDGSQKQQKTWKSTALRRGCLYWVVGSTCSHRQQGIS